MGLCLVAFSMDRYNEVLDIYNRRISVKDKIRLLEDLVLDLFNELRSLEAE